MSNKGSIRLGILCSGTMLPRWQAQAVRHMLEIPDVELVAVGTPRMDDNTRVTRPLGLRAYVERRCLTLLAARACINEDLSDPLALVPGVALAPDRSSLGDRSIWSPFAPDLLISFLGTADPISKTDTNAYPVWEFRFGGQGVLPNGNLGMRSQFTRQPAMRVQLAAQGTGKLEMEFPLRTEQEEASLDPMLLGAAWLPARVITALRRGEDLKHGSTSIGVDQDPDRKENMIFMIRSWIDLEMRQLGDHERIGANLGEWNLGILHQPISSLLSEDASTNIRWLPAPSEGNNRMEPFGYTAPDGQLNVLYRKKHRNKVNDEIARLRPKSDSVLKRSRSMLTTSAPLHYPFVVERPEGAFAVISYPHQDRTELFRVADSNDRMDHVKTLLNRALTSPTLIHFQERWWLMGTDPEAPGSVLLAYHAVNMEGPFTPHLLNPLKVEAIGTRPAGTPFLHEGDLWRPTLDASIPGTMAIILNHVQELTPSTFRETMGKRIAGFRGTVYAHGIRTVCAMGDITLIDGFRGPSAERKPSKDQKRRQKRNGQ